MAKPNNPRTGKARTTRVTEDGKEYLRDRLEALRSLDETKLRAFHRKYNSTRTPPEDPLQFWGGVHKARLHTLEMTKEEQDFSRKWLIEHGFTRDLTGDKL